MRKEKKYCKFIKEQKGISIPMPVFYIKNLNEIERFLLSITYNYTKQSKNDNRFGLLASNTILGDFLGYTPKHISKSFKKLESLGLVEFEESINNGQIKKARFENFPKIDEIDTLKKSIWIPKKYIYAESINNIQKILISEFESFHNNKKNRPIRAGDVYFSKLLMRSPKTINRNINDLKDKGYIKTKRITDLSTSFHTKRFIYFIPTVTIY